MNSQLSSSKDAEYNINQSSKSQQILNSVSNFHVKTEQQERHDDHLRSPENHKNDLRDTWRRPRMPYNKLPDAFQIKQKKKKTNREVIDNLDRIVKYNEYKEIQKYLEPIPLERKAEERPRDFMQNGNPLVTYQKYLKIKTKFSEQLQDKDISINRYKTFSTKQAAQSIRVTDCITLQLLKRGHNTGTIKKMLHVPSLKLLSIRQQPLNSKQTRNSIKEWLMLWQGRLGFEENKRFVAVYAVAYNYPQGAVSIVTEYFKYGSLLDLLQCVITLPERVIQQIFTEVLQNLGYFYEISELQFGGLSPSQIMITQSGKIKLGLGLFYHLSSSNSNCIYNLRANKPASLEFNTTHKNFMKSTLERSSNPQLQKSLDVFRIGLMMLQCAIGGFDNFQQSALLKESIKNICTEEGQRAIEHQNVCCLIHSEIYLLERAGQQDESSRRDRLQISKVILYSKFLKDRFSMPFISFLCSCLKLQHSKRATFRELTQHSFLQNQTSKDAKSVNVSLLDLIQVSSECNQEYIGSMQKERVDKIIGHILHVFNDCRPEQLTELLQNYKSKILNLGKLIGFNDEALGQRLYAALEEMAKVEKGELTT